MESKSMPFMLIRAFWIWLLAFENETGIRQLLTTFRTKLHILYMSSHLICNVIGKWSEYHWFIESLVVKDPSNKLTGHVEKRR